MIPGFECRLARLDAATVLTECLGPRFESMGKKVSCDGSGSRSSSYIFLHMISTECEYRFRILSIT
jgi:hypothetical protein